MGILKGKEFFPWQITNVLDAAYNVALPKYMNSLEYQTPDADVWRTSYYNLAAIKVQVNKLIDSDNTAIISEGSPLWLQIDTYLAPVADNSSVISEVLNLPDSQGIIPGLAEWAKPMLIGGAILGVAGLGWMWIRGK